MKYGRVLRFPGALLHISPVPWLLWALIACAGCQKESVEALSTSRVSAPIGSRSSWSNPELQEPQLHVELSGGDHDPVLVVEFSNTSRKTVTVDKDLVFLLYIEIKEQVGSSVEWDRAGRLGHTQDDWRDRFVRLSPGGILRREIALRRGFAEFVTLIGSSLTADGQVRHDRIAAYETMCRLPDDVLLRNVREITVGYGGYPRFAEGFRHYTGLDSDVLDLYRGSLKATVKLNSEGRGKGVN